MNVSSEEFAEIDALDFEPIKNKLMHKSGMAWSRERAQAAEREYKRFLYLMKKHPNELTAPSMEVDHFWHQHILDTAKYARDCDAIFGYFLHHYPYLGISGEPGAELRQKAGERMREIYAQAFGEPPANGTPGYGAKAQATGYCTVTQHPPRAEASAAGTAYCTVTAAREADHCADPDPGQTAYCTVTGRTAYCTITAPAELAYCTVTAGAPAVQAQRPRRATVSGAARKEDVACCTVNAQAANRYVNAGNRTTWPPMPGRRAANRTSGRTSAAVH